jgi:carboxyl-terminal processing protease
MKSWVMVPVIVVVAFISFLTGNNFDGKLISKASEKQVVANAGLEQDLTYTDVEEVYDSLKSSYDGTLDKTKLIDGLKKGLVDSTGDPYTSYFSKTQAELFNTQLSGTFSGIGAELSRKDNRPVIVTPIEGFPAFKAGVKSGDVIVKIDGTDTAGLTVDEAVLKIRGQKGTDVKLALYRDSAEVKNVELTITRDTIVIESVKSEMLEGNIGYIRMSQFGESSDKRVREEVDKLKGQGMKAVILDLRGNGGGLLTGAVNVASLWLDKKVVVEEKRDGKTIDNLTSASGSAVLAATPSVVLIDEGSASASEIVAGALKDYGSATLIGVKSFGKGSVQQVKPLKDGSELKVTIARWYTPKGRNIDKEGILPDQEVKVTPEDVANKVDAQKNKAIEFLRSKL